MSVLLRRTIPVGITFIVGMILFVEYYLKVPYAGAVATMLRNFGIVVAAFALGLGAGNLVIVHGQYVRKRKPGQWFFSVWMFVVMITFIVIGIGFTVNAPSYVWLFQNTLTAVSTTTYSLLAFFIASAAYRAFRLRTKESSLMLVAGVIMMLGNIPAIVSSFSPIFDLATWIMDVPTTAGLRALLMTAAVGTIVLGLRTLIGRERGYAGGE